MAIELVHLYIFLSRQNVQTDFQRGQSGQDVGAHEIGQGEAGVGGTGEDGTAFVQIGDALTGEVIVAQQAAAVRIPFQGLAEEHGEELPLVLRGTDEGSKFTQQVHPGVDVGGAVVAVDHGHRCTGGGGDHVDLPVDTQGVVRNQHGKVGGTGGDIAGALPHGVGGGHAGARIALTRGHGNAGKQIAGRIQELGAAFGEHAAALAGYQDLGQDIPQLPISAAHGIEFLHHGLVIVQLGRINGEHTGGLADAHHLFSGEQVVDVACQGGEEGDVSHMVFLVQNGLVQMGNAPALGNVEVQGGGQLFGSLAGDGVSPGAEACQLVAVLVKGKVAVHHGGNADGAHLGECLAELFGNVLFQLPVAVLNTGGDGLHGIGPDTVHQLVLPFVGAGGDGNVVFVDEHCLDPGGAQLNAQGGGFEIHSHSPLVKLEQRRSFCCRLISIYGFILS